MLMGDFNLTVENNNLEVYFMSAFDLECMIKKLHVSNLLILNYIDLILKTQLIKSNAKKSFIIRLQLPSNGNIDQNLKNNTIFE